MRERIWWLTNSLLLQRTANPTECNRIPSFNKIAFIFNDKIQCTNIGWKGLCTTAIHAFICGLLGRKREAKCHLLELLVSFWVAAFEKWLLLRAEKRAKASTIAQNFEGLPSLPSHGLEWVTRPLTAVKCQEAGVNSLNDCSHFCRGFSHHLRFCLDMFLVTVSFCLF